MNIRKPLIILFKFVFVVFVFIFAMGVIIVLGLNIFKFGIYKEYYSILTKEATSPGINQGFMPQGITYSDNLFITVGYMNDGSNSRIYTVNCTTGEISYFPLLSENVAFYGHTGGIQYIDGYLYLANEGNSLYKFSAATVYQTPGTKIEIGAPVQLNSNTSYVYGNEEYLYVGESHKEGLYPCSNKIEYNGETHYAIVEKYSISDLTKPLAVYSVPEEVQGFCIKEDGTIILSSSWGIKSSKIYIYTPEKIIKTGKKYNGVDLFFLGEPEKIIKAPAMSEDLDIIKDSKGQELVVTLFESACNKYVFGKLFFANYIASIKI